MTINIEKMRADMRWEARKFLLSLVLGTAAAVGAGVALANYVNSKQQFQSQFPPGTVITIPPAPSRTVEVTLNGDVDAWRDRAAGPPSMG